METNKHARRVERELHIKRLVSEKQQAEYYEQLKGNTHRPGDYGETRDDDNDVNNKTGVISDESRTSIDRNGSIWRSPGTGETLEQKSQPRTPSFVDDIKTLDHFYKTCSTAGSSTRSPHSFNWIDDTELLKRFYKNRGKNDKRNDNVFSSSLLVDAEAWRNTRKCVFNDVDDYTNEMEDDIISEDISRQADEEKLLESMEQQRQMQRFSESQLAWCENVLVVPKNQLEHVVQNEYNDQYDADKQNPLRVDDKSTTGNLQNVAGDDESSCPWITCKTRDRNTKRGDGEEDSTVISDVTLEPTLLTMAAYLSGNSNPSSPLASLSTTKNITSADEDLVEQKLRELENIVEKQLNINVERNGSPNNSSPQQINEHEEKDIYESNSPHRVTICTSSKVDGSNSNVLKSSQNYRAVSLLDKCESGSNDDVSEFINNKESPSANGNGNDSAINESPLRLHCKGNENKKNSVSGKIIVTPDRTYMMEVDALIRMEEGDYDASIKILKQVLEIRLRRQSASKDKQNDYAVARTLCSFGMVFEKKGEMRLAERMFRQFLQVYRMNGMNDGDAIIDINNHLSEIKKLTSQEGGIQKKSYSLDENTIVTTQSYDEVNKNSAYENAVSTAPSNDKVDERNSIDDNVLPEVSEENVNGVDCKPVESDELDARKVLLVKYLETTGKTYGEALAIASKFDSFYSTTNKPVSEGMIEEKNVIFDTNAEKIQNAECMLKKKGKDEEKVSFVKGGQNTDDMGGRSERHLKQEIMSLDADLVGVRGSKQSDNIEEQQLKPLTKEFDFSDFDSNMKFHQWIENDDGCSEIRDHFDITAISNHHSDSSFPRMGRRQTTLLPLKNTEPPSSTLIQQRPLSLSTGGTRSALRTLYSPKNFNKDEGCEDTDGSYNSISIGESSNDLGDDRDNTSGSANSFGSQKRNSRSVKSLLSSAMCKPTNSQIRCKAKRNSMWL